MKMPDEKGEILTFLEAGGSDYFEIKYPLL